MSMTLGVMFTCAYRVDLAEVAPVRRRAGLNQPRVRARRLRRELFVHVQCPPLQRDGAGPGCTMSTAASSASTTACSGTASTARPRPILSPANPCLESLACGAGGVALPGRPLRGHACCLAPRLHLVAAGWGDARVSWEGTLRRDMRAPTVREVGNPRTRPEKHPAESAPPDEHFRGEGACNVRWHRPTVLHSRKTPHAAHSAAKRRGGGAHSPK